MSWLWWVWPLGPLYQAWPQIMPNLVASIITGGVVWLWGRRHLKRIHERHDRHEEMLRRALNRPEDR